VRVTGFDGGATQNHQKNRKVTLMLNGNERIIKHKVSLLNLAEELGNVSKACQMMGVPRDTINQTRKWPCLKMVGPFIIFGVFNRAHFDCESYNPGPLCQDSCRL
jgi:hypothetical protein